MLLCIALINYDFYKFLARRMGWLTAFTAIPFHVLFYFYNGISFITGIGNYFFRSLSKAGRQKAMGRAAQ